MVRIKDMIKRATELEARLDDWSYQTHGLRGYAELSLELNQLRRAINNYCVAGLADDRTLDRILDDMAGTPEPEPKLHRLN